MGNSAYQLSAGTNPWRHVQTQTIGGAVSSVDFTSGFSDDGIAYAFVLAYISVDSTAGTGRSISVRTSTDGGTTFDSSAGNYKWAMPELTAGGTLTQSTSTSATLMEVVSNVDGGATASASGIIELYNPSNTTRYKHISGFTGCIESGGDAELTVPFGTRQATADIDGVQFIPSAGNFDEGKIAMYRLVAS